MNECLSFNQQEIQHYAGLTTRVLGEVNVLTKCDRLRCIIYQGSATVKLPGSSVNNPNMQCLIPRLQSNPVQQ